LSYSKIVECNKKKATPILTHDTTFSDFTRVTMWKFMNYVGHRKWAGWHMT